jgi:hypothetical protein
MSLNIQTNVAMPQSQMAFRGNKTKQTAKIVDELGFELPRKICLEQLRRTNPDMYKHVMINDIEHKVMSMSNWEIIKTLFKGIFKIK